MVTYREERAWSIPKPDLPRASIAALSVEKSIRERGRKERADLDLQKATAYMQARREPIAMAGALFAVRGLPRTAAM